MDDGLGHDLVDAHLAPHGGVSDFLAQGEGVRDTRRCINQTSETTGDGSSNTIRPDTTKLKYLSTLQIVTTFNYGHKRKIRSIFSLDTRRKLH